MQLNDKTVKKLKHCHTKHDACSYTTKWCRHRHNSSEMHQHPSLLYSYVSHVISAVTQIIEINLTHLSLDFSS